MIIITIIIVIIIIYVRNFFLKEPVCYRLLGSILDALFVSLTQGVSEICDDENL